MGIDFGWLDAGFVIAAIALWVSIVEMRRNGSVLLRVIDFSTSTQQSASENNWQPFVHYKVKFRNLGIPLHEISVAIEFQAGDRDIRVELAPDDKTKRIEFSKGMIAAFHFKSFQSIDQTAWLSKIDDCQKQKVRITVRSQGYLVKTIQCGNLINRIKKQWNRFATNLLFKNRKMLRYLDNVTFFLVRMGT